MNTRQETHCTKDFLQFNDVELVCSVIRDITEQKKMLDAIEKRIISLTSPEEDVEDITFEELFDIAWKSMKASKEVK